VGRLLAPSQKSVPFQHSVSGHDLLMGASLTILSTRPAGFGHPHLSARRLQSLRPISGLEPTSHRRYYYRVHLFGHSLLTRTSNAVVLVNLNRPHRREIA